MLALQQIGFTTNVVLAHRYLFIVLTRRHQRDGASSLLGLYDMIPLSRVSFNNLDSMRLDMHAICYPTYSSDRPGAAGGMDFVSSCEIACLALFFSSLFFTSSSSE